MGIAMGTPFFQCKDQLAREGVFVCSSNYALYGDMSRRVIATISHFCAEMEVYSIDECFAVISNDQILERVREMQQTILKWTGIPVSIGIGPTKTLAKAANHCAKKDPLLNGICSLNALVEQEMLLRALSAGDIWGVGKRREWLLNSHAIGTAWDLRNAEDGWVRKNLSVVGLRTVWELRGISCLSLEEIAPPKKSIVSSRSFGRPVVLLQELEEAVSTYTVRAANKMRKQKCLASYIEVFVATNESTLTQQIILSEPTAYTPKLIEAAKKVLKRIFTSGTVYKKAGVHLGGIVPEEAFQPTLFSTKNKDLDAKQERFVNLMNEMNKKLGRRALQFAAEGIEQPWKMQQNQRSPRFTTRWNEILTVK